MLAKLLAGLTLVLMVVDVILQVWWMFQGAVQSSPRVWEESVWKSVATTTHARTERCAAPMDVDTPAFKVNPHTITAHSELLPQMKPIQAIHRARG